jgi:diacylglycerol kinase
MSNKKFKITERLKSFAHAGNGLKLMIRGEHNFRIHLIFLVAVLVLSFILKLSAYEWLAICFACGFVISLEIINTSIEKLADFVSLERSQAIKVIKDLSAAGVLVSAMTAIIVGCIIFIPKIISVCLKP